MRELGDFAAALRAADDALVDAAPARAPDSDRLRRPLPARRRPSPGWRAAPLALAASVAIGIWASRQAPREARPALPPGWTLVGSVKGAAVDATPDGIRLTRGSAQVRDALRGVAIELEAPAELRAEGPGLRVVRGIVRFTVAPRASGRPALTIGVGGGAIEVVGTRFEVRQEEGVAGSVQLLEGTIRFVSGTTRRTLRAGETLAWPLASPAPRVDASGPPPPAPAPVEPPPADVEALLARVEHDRRASRFEDAAAALRGALEAPLRPATRERLSYELGSLETYELGDVEVACTHWRRHRAEFSGGRYARQVTAAERRLGCDP